MVLFSSNSTFADISQAVIGILAFGAYVLAPGWLLSRLLGIRRGAFPAESLLWSLGLGIPVAVLICVLLGRVLSPAGVNFGFLILAVAALWQATRHRKTSPSAPVSTARRRASRIALVSMLVFAIFCIAETVDVRIGDRLYISTVLADWSVRVSVVSACMRSGVPPINGLSTVSTAGLGHAPHLRYYYFWYVLVAQVARTFSLSPQPALAASCVWAGWGFIATCFLSLKYMLRNGLRAKYLVFLGLLCVLGLDLLPTAWLWLAPSHHPYPEMEWWHQDRTPSFLGSVLYAPHHIAAWCSLMAGFLVLQTTHHSGSAEESSGRERMGPLTRVAVHATFAGIAFAAAAGLSLFPTLCFVFALAFWAVDLIRRRDGLTLLTLASSGVISLLLAHPYLRELSGGSSAASGFANFAWRNDAFVALQMGRRAALATHTGLSAFLLRQPVVFALDFFELGFYTLVLVWAIRHDLLTKPRRTRGLCAWWALLLGSAIPALFLTSTATSGPNDLGVDAGFLFRLALQLRAAEWISQRWRCWKERPRTRTVQQRWAFASAVCLAGLGLGAQLYQVLSIRFYFPVVASNLVHKQMDALTKDHLPERLFNIRSALRTFDSEVPPSRSDTEAIQFNPVGEMTPAEVYLNDHQIASWDTGCGTSYGGDYKSCPPIYRSLLFLYGNTEAGVLKGRAQNDRQDAAASRVATVADLAEVCRHLELRAVVAESTDSIWRQPQSWVWSGPVLVSNSSVRVISCPAGSWRE